jgi:hypothetical protein
VVGVTANTAAAPAFRRAAGGAGARFEYAMWPLCAVAAVFAVVAAFDLAYLLRVRAALPTPDLRVVSAGQHLGTAEMVLFVVLFGASVIWYRLTIAVIDGLGVNPTRALSVVVTVWLVGAAATVGAGGFLPRADLAAADAFGVRLRWMVPILVARLALTAVLGLAMFGQRRRIYAVLLASGVAPLRGRSGEPPVTLLELTRRASAIVVPLVPLPVAGDAWWSEVADRLATAGAALPLLEVAGEDRRWHRVEPGADLAALRGSLRPGATVTLFPAPWAGDGAVPDAPGAEDDPEALSAEVR